MSMWLSISGIGIIVAMIVLGVILWKVAKLLLLPVQILLFLLLMFIAYRLLVPENARSEKIDGMVRHASDSALRFVKRKAAEKLAAEREAPAPGSSDAGEGTGGDPSR